MRFLILIVLLAPLTGFGQTGNFFLSHYAPAKGNHNNTCFDIAQDSRGVMYFATNAGIQEFDGRNWDILKGQPAIYSVKITPNDDIFWAGARGFGRIGINSNGFQEMVVLSDSSVQNVFQTLPIANATYFLNDEALFFLDNSSLKYSKVKSDSITGSFLKVFELFGACYVNAENGIFKLDKQSLTKSKLAIQGDIVFISRIDDTYVFGTTENRVYVLREDLVPRPVKIQDEQYANASVIINGTWVNRQLLALGTLRGGVIFINPITGITQEIVNYATGLPDNEVISLAHDHSQNIWVAHDQGFTRIAPYLPFRSFSYYPGLQGNVLCASTHDGIVYAGTSLGLFRLEKEDVYEEIVYYAEVAVPSKKEIKSSSQKEEITNSSPTTESKRRGLFKFLKKRDKSEKQEETKEVLSEGKQTGSVQPIQKRRVKRTQKVLRSSQFVYKKVKGIDAKVTHLIEVDGTLVASGLGGVYEVTGLESKPVLEQPVRHLFLSEKENILFTSTYDDEVKCLVPNDKGWTSINILDHVSDQIHYIMEGMDNEVWLCGLDRLYKVTLNERLVSNVETIEVENRDMQTMFGVAWDKNVLLVNSQGFFSYNRSSNKFSLVDSLPVPMQYFPYNGSILYRDKHAWNIVGKENEQDKLQILNLFQDLRFVSSDRQSGDLWIISKRNELYKFFDDKISTEVVAFPLVLKSVINEDLRTGSRSKIHISEDKSATTFEIVQPDFVSPEAVEFRFQLKGMSEEWSDWGSNNNIITYPYLPPGEYTLEVESRNVFGKITELEPLSFEVLPPYWKRSWFYAMEFSILATLVLLSFRLSARYRIVSRILSLLTIILLIEFIQTVIDSSLTFGKASPVIDFIVQVFVALLILPVEGFLRNLMLRSLDQSSKIYQFIGPKASETLEHEPFETFEAEKSKSKKRFRL